MVISAPCDGLHRRDAGADRLAFHDHRAGAALAQAAAEFRAAQAEIVAQRIEQRSRRIEVQRVAWPLTFRVMALILPQGYSGTAFPSSMPDLG